MTTVSVLIVNYNAGELLTECVGSVLAPSPPPPLPEGEEGKPLSLGERGWGEGLTDGLLPEAELEVLVADNASRDNSIAVLKKAWDHDPRLRIFENQANLGFAAAVNRMVPHSRGEFILVLNPDCALEPGTLAQFLTVMEQHPRAGMAGAAVYNAHGQLEHACRRRVPTPGRSLTRVLGLHKLFPGKSWAQGFEYRGSALPEQVQSLEGISGSCMFVRRTALEQVGLMDEEYFLHCEDLDWFMRFRASAWDIVFVPWIRVRHHKGACSREAVRVLWYKHRGMLRFYHKFFRHNYPSALLWLVSVAVGARFVLLSGYTLIRGIRGF